MSGNAQVPVKASPPDDTHVRDKPKAKPTGAVTVVGLGASAGGLEAFEKFFPKVPRHSGLAFVIVQHLDPSHDSLLAEILQRQTPLPVHEAQDRMEVEADCIYVIPPNRYMSLAKGMLHLSVPEQPRGQRMPIDFFFESMALDRYESGIAIILSGTGSDGTLGAQAIITGGGVVLVQAPATAKYNGMPDSAIKAGWASHVLPVEAMPAALLSKKRLAKLPDAATDGIDRILLALRQSTGHDFSQYKKSTIGRRIARRMTVHNIDDRRVYAQYMQKNPLETRALFKELLINVTHFFRDAEAFEILEKNLLPTLLAGKTASDVVRVWVAGCATGEEAYSIAILLREYMDRTETHFNIQLYATDLDDEAIQFPRNATYSLSISDDVSPERLHQHFVKDEDAYKVSKKIREMVVFATQNVIKEPPFTRLDLLCCRNVMIYLEPQMQELLIPVFHYALLPGGVLFVSPSEGIGNHADLFSPIDRKWKLYRATSVHKLAPKMTVNRRLLEHAHHSQTSDDTMKKIETINFTELTKRVLLQTFALASVVIDVQGNILYVHGDTGKYLRPAPGAPSLNVIDMAREDLQLDLRTAMDTAVTDGLATVKRQVPLRTETGFVQISLSVRVLPKPETDTEQRFLLINFEDTDPPVKAATEETESGVRSPLDGRIEDLERHLSHTKANLQATIEEQQATNEELKSTNEEMQSTNEELQSTNEELETSREELQSVNEELITVNTELQTKIGQLSDMQNDMKNLMDNMNVGTIFLDSHLAIRRFTREATRVYRLAQTDVDRSLGDIKSRLAGGDLLHEAQKRAQYAERLRGASANHGWRYLSGANTALPHAGKHDRWRGIDVYRHYRARANSTSYAVSAHAGRGCGGYRSRAPAGTGP